MGAVCIPVKQNVRAALLANTIPKLALLACTMPTQGYTHAIHVGRGRTRLAWGKLHATIVPLASLRQDRLAPAALPVQRARTSPTKEPARAFPVMQATIATKRVLISV